MSKWKIISLNVSGSALISAVVFSVIFSIVGIGTISLISRGNQLHTRDVQVIESYWANEAMRRIALRFLTRVTVPPQNDITGFTVTTGTRAPFEINGLSPLTNITKNGKIYTITVSTQIGPVTNTNSANGITFDTYAKFTWFETGPYGGTPWKGQIVHGNYHANENFLLAWNMTDEVHVDSQATCAGTFVRSPNPYPDEYGKGIKVSGGNPWRSYSWFNRRLPHYSSVDPIETSSLSPDSGILNSGFVIENTYPGYNYYRAVLDNSGNGRVSIYGRNSSSSNWSYRGRQYINTLNQSYNGVLSSSRDIYVEGVVENQLTIVSKDDIFIDGDITLDGVARGDMPALANPDMLGLVAGDDIIISKHYLRESGDLHVYAALFANKGKLKAEGYKEYDSDESTWEANGRNELHLIGSSLVDKQCGTFRGTTYGFRMHNWGDPRFMGNIAAPPGLPDVRQKDNEMRDHWDEPFAMNFPITVSSWSNALQ